MVEKQIYNTKYVFQDLKWKLFLEFTSKVKLIKNDLKKYPRNVNTDNIQDLIVNNNNAKTSTKTKSLKALSETSTALWIIPNLFTYSAV